MFDLTFWLLAILLSIFVYIIFLKVIINLVTSLIASSVVISCLLLLWNYEYFSFVYLILYLGAILILFLFIIMLFNLDEKIALYEFEMSWSPVFFSLFSAKLYFLFFNSWFNYIVISKTFHIFDSKTAIFLDRSFYNVFLYFFNNFGLILVLLGLILLSVMIGVVKVLVNANQRLLILYEIKTKNKNL